MTHTELINAIIKQCGYKSYLEIGVQYAERNFDLVECQQKEGIDQNVAVKCLHHMTSDKFFAKADPAERWDIVFIDGDHRWMPALRDIGNSLYHLSDNGCIVMDNLNPLTFDEQSLTAGSVQSGTCWRAYAILRCSRRDLSQVCIDFHQGMGVIQRGEQKLFAPPEDAAGMPCYFGKPWEIDWPLLEAHREELLNLVSVEEFERDYLPKMRGHEKPTPLPTEPARDIREQ